MYLTKHNKYVEEDKYSCGTARRHPIAPLLPDDVFDFLVVVPSTRLQTNSLSHCYGSPTSRLRLRKPMIEKHDQRDFYSDKCLFLFF